MGTSLYGDTGSAFGDPAGTFASTFAGGVTPPPAWFPTVTIECAFTSGIYDNPAATAWTDVSTYVTAFSVTRGRTSELEQPQAGTATITFDNTDRRFDFDHVTSPFYGKLRPRVQVRIRATWNGTTYDRFRGYVDEWGPLEASPHDYDSMTVQCYDAVSLLSARPVTPGNVFTIEDPVLGTLDNGKSVLGGDLSRPAEREGTRIRAILAYIGWPAELTDVDEGLTALIDDAPGPDIKVWDYLQVCARSGGGVLYVESSGTVVYRQRREWTRRPTQRTPQARFSDLLAGDALPYVDLQLSPPSAKRVKNRIVRGRGQGDPIVATDMTSIGLYEVCEDSQTDLLVVADDELAAMAQDRLALTKAPSPRIESISVAAEQNTTALWPQVLGRTLGDQVTVERTPLYGDGLTVRNCRIEQVGETVDAATLAWRTMWALSPVDSRKFFTIEDPTLGKLDSPSVVIAY